MPMYTAASPGNLLPKFSGPADGGTIARRASLLHTATGEAEKDAPFDLPVAGAEPANAFAPVRTTRSAKANLAFMVAPLRTRAPRPHAHLQRRVRGTFLRGNPACERRYGAALSLESRVP